MRSNRHRAPAVGWAAARAELAALLLPVHCPGCGRPDMRICPACRAAFAGPGQPVPEVTGSRPVAWPPDLEGLTVATYQGPVRRVLHAWKDDGRHDLTAVVAGALTGQLTALARALAPDRLDVVPVPSSTANVRRRGADLLRRATAGALHSSAGAGGSGLTLTPVLRQRPRVADQRGLGARARTRNIRGALVCTQPLPGRAVLIVDDVVTTGASTAEAARVLAAAGAHVVLVLTVAATPRPG